MKANNSDIKISIQNELQLLEDIISSPKNFAKDIYFEILKNQNNFAKYSSNERKILSLSLNTQKNYANEFLTLGYSHLNKCRELAYKKIINLSFTKPKNSKDSLKEEKSELLNKIDKIEKQNLKLVRILNDIRYTLISISKNSNEIETKKIIEKKLNIFEIILSYTLEENNNDK